MTSVQSITVGLGLSDYSTEATTPTTPRAPVQQSSHTHPATINESSNDTAASTPTTATFNGISGQRPLPNSPFRNSFPASNRPLSENITETTNKRDSQISIQSNESQDIDMAESDGEGEAGSDAESVDPETGRTTKKKKGQRFFCTDFPPCKLSFTRSEHLARHIRKHTGERPFQCHCSRRFSRLDNLRQHAQTVHVNEEIPIDSLAATGTRFQRQIRTDRVSRPPNSRSRASTASSAGGHHRGHSRNLSTSSIGSTASTISRDDIRRRPAPIIMASDPSKPRLTLDVLRSQTSTPPSQTSFFRESSEGLSTPTSTTFSTGGHSPGYGSSIGSPASNARHSGYWDNRGHGRRLSVPSGPVPFQSPQNVTYGSPYLSPLASSQASTFSNVGGSYGTPINPSNSAMTKEAAEAESRRRTWHPTPHTYTNFSRPSITSHFSRPATSGLVYNQTPDALQPAYKHPPPPSATQPQRLPGIETFMQAPRRPSSPPPVRVGSPMHIDPPPQQSSTYPAPPPQPQSGTFERRGHSSWDMSLHQNLTKLHIRNNSQLQEPQPWNQQQQPIEARQQNEGVDSATRIPIIHQEPQKRPSEELEYPSPNPNRARRQGWYAGPPLKPITSHPRTSPGGSTSSEGVPKTPTAPPVEHHPSIIHSNGFVERAPSNSTSGEEKTVPNSDSQHPAPWGLSRNDDSRQYHEQRDTNMSGLDVLVAAATRESNAAPKA